MMVANSISRLAGAGFAACLAGSVAGAQAPSIAQDAIAAFAAHCFNPRLTGQLVTERLDPTGARVDFYDLDPFSNVPPTLGVALDATPGTDRRCEVSFDGDYSDQAAEAVLAALEAEGIRASAPLPDTHDATPGTALLGARQLNPNRIAVVHVGTRPGPNGIETFMNVERLTPSTE